VTDLISCREAKECLHMVPGCICDTDPVPVGEDIVDRLGRIKSACTQKTFLHNPDWREGKQIVQDAIAEIRRLQAEKQGIGQ